VHPERNSPLAKTWLIAAFALILSACSAGADKSAAEAEVRRFHQMFDAGRYAEIYRQAAPEFRQSSSEEVAVNFMRSIHERLGPVRSTAQQGWRVNLVSGGNIVILSYQTEFARARGVETFTYRVSGASAQLMGYHASSPVLTIAPPPPPVTLEENAAASRVEPARR
jgi:hypothetical protein